MVKIEVVLSKFEELAGDLRNRGKAERQSLIYGDEESYARAEGYDSACDNAAEEINYLVQEVRNANSNGS